MKIGLAHDSFTLLGGAERVVDVLHKIFPGAPVYTLVFDEKNRNKYEGWDIRTSWLNKFYKIVPKIKFLLPLIPFAAQSLDLSGYDLVISSSSGFIRNIKLKSGARHICYCHSPTRFLWVDKNYITEEVPLLFRPLARLFANWMKIWDLRGISKIELLIANSEEVKKRIKNIYNRDSEVIYPPINFDFWSSGLGSKQQKDEYFLLAGRLQAHKHNAFIIELFNDLKIPLHVVGTGRQEKYLRSIAKNNIKFFGRVSDEELKKQYQNAKVFIFPQLEDFGLMPLEAAACGTPTLAYGRGGALETVVEGITGEFFYEYEPKELKQVILNWQSDKYNVENLCNQAKKFGEKEFIEKVKKAVSQYSL